MKIIVAKLGLVACLSTLSVVACGGDDADAGSGGKGGSSGASGGSSGKGGTSGSSSGRGGDQSTGGSSNGGMSGAGGASGFVRAVRFGHFAADVPAFDICYRLPSGGPEYVGPIFKAAGNAAGLSYGEVSAYRVLEEAGSHNYRFVAPNATDCGTPLYDYGNFEPSFLIALTNADFYWSVQFMAPAPGGMLPTSNRATDPFSSPLDSSADVLLQLRNHLVQVSGRVPPVDFGPITNGTFSAIFSNLTVENSQGFAPPNGAAFELRQTGMTTALLAATLTIPGMTKHSGWVFGEIGSATHPPRLIICQNVATPGPFSDCQTCTSSAGSLQA